LSSEFQGKGLGRFLINEAKKTARKIGVLRFRLHTCEFDSPGALSFYQKNGFGIFDEKLENAMYPVDFIKINSPDF
jgi:GNAT superfamily N-acetyltransferase